MLNRNYKKLEFINGEIYHIYNRGVEKRNIFESDNDRFRFIFSLYECNDCNPVIMRDRIYQRKERNKPKQIISGKVSIHPTYGHLSDKPRERLVDILAFCLMPNHYHIAIRQLIDGGVSRFMRKLGDSYVKYFNERHFRKGLGSLFQGKFKARWVENNDQFINLVTYLHMNPIGILEKNWKEYGINDAKAAMNFLNQYRWSSYFDYVGKNNFPSVIQKDFALKVFAGKDNQEYEKTGMKNAQNFINGWLEYKNKMAMGLSKIGM